MPTSVVTNATGDFKMFVDAPLVSSVTATCSDGTSPARWFSVYPGDDVSVEVRFAGAYTISGIVLYPDSTGAPRTRVRVACDKSAGDSFTQADGTFSIVLADSGKYTVLADADSWIQDTPVIAQLTDDCPEASIVVRLIPTAVISGRVRWSTGDPVEGAIVTATAVRESAEVVSQVVGALARRTARSGSDGAFAVAQLNPSLRYDIAAIADTETGPGISEKVLDVQADASGVEVTIDRALAHAFNILITVVDAIGLEPIGSYQVRVGLWGGRSESYLEATPTVVSNTEGQFEFAWPRTIPCSIEVTAEGYCVRVAGPVLIDGQDVHLTVPLERLR